MTANQERPTEVYQPLIQCEGPCAKLVRHRYVDPLNVEHSFRGFELHDIYACTVCGTERVYG